MHIGITHNKNRFKKLRKLKKLIGNGYEILIIRKCKNQGVKTVCLPYYTSVAQTCVFVRALNTNWKLRLRRSKRKIVSFYLNAVRTLMRKHSAACRETCRLFRSTLTCFSEVCARYSAHPFCVLIRPRDPVMCAESKFAGHMYLADQCLRNERPQLSTTLLLFATAKNNALDSY